MMPNTTRQRVRSRAVLLAVVAVVAGCGSLAPGGFAPGTPIAQARHALIAPAGEYPLPGGGTRLEFPQGSFGKQTYMLDFDAQGLLTNSTQVLTEANFENIQPGMPTSEVRMRLGRPAHVFSVPRQKLHIWNYRFFRGDCIWFQVSLSDVSQQVTETGMGTDPACDGPSSPRD